MDSTRRRQAQPCGNRPCPRGKKQSQMARASCSSVAVASADADMASNSKGLPGQHGRGLGTRQTSGRRAADMRDPDDGTAHALGRVCMWLRSRACKCERSECYCAIAGADPLARNWCVQRRSAQSCRDCLCGACQENAFLASCATAIAGAGAGAGAIVMLRGRS